MSFADTEAASAATANGGPADWINVTTSFAGHLADPTGATDSSGAINYALLQAAPGQVVYMPAGIYKIYQPLNIPPAVTLAGAKGGTNAGDTNTTTPHGTVIQIAGPSSTTDRFTGLQTQGSTSSTGTPLATITAAIALLDCQAGGWNSTTSFGIEQGASAGIELRDFFIDGQYTQNLGLTVDGINALGAVHSVKIKDVAMNNLTGSGVTGDKNWLSPATTGLDRSPDGWICERVLVQNVGNYGFGPSIWQDGVFITCHAQGSIGSTAKDGFYIDAAPTRLVCCRSDYHKNAFTADSYAVPSSYGTIILMGCTSDQCSENAFNIVNSSASNPPSARNPVIIDSCHAVNVGAAGLGNGYAGIAVQGPNTRVTVSNTNIWAVQTGPDFGLSVTGNPWQVRISGGNLNGVKAPVEFAPSANRDTDFYLGPDVTQFSGVLSSTSFAPTRSLVPTSCWISLTLQNGYANSGSGPDLKCRSLGDTIEIVGDLTVPGSADKTIALLPAGVSVPTTQQLNVTVISNSSSPPPAASVLTPRVYVQGGVAQGTQALLVASNIPVNTTRIFIGGVVYSSA